MTLRMTTNPGNMFLSKYFFHFSFIPNCLLQFLLNPPSLYRMGSQLFKRQVNKYLKKAKSNRLTIGNSTKQRKVWKLGKKYIKQKSIYFFLITNSSSLSWRVVAPILLACMSAACSTYILSLQKDHAIKNITKRVLFFRFEKGIQGSIAPSINLKYVALMLKYLTWHEKPWVSEWDYFHAFSARISFVGLTGNCNQPSIWGRGLKSEYWQMKSEVNWQPRSIFWNSA